MKHILPLLVLFASIAYSQTTVIGGASGGGSSTFDGLSDVDITAVADGDGLRHNGTDWVDTELFDPTTTDLLAARMSANVRTAVGSGLSSDCIPYESGGVLTCSSLFRFLTNDLYLGNSDPSSDLRIVFGSSANRVAMYGDVNVIRFTTGNGASNPFTIGGSQTALFQDTTAGSGDTLVIVKGGDTEAGNVFEVQDSTGTVNAAFTAAGVLAANSALVGPFGASRITGSAGFYQDIPEITPSGNPAANTLRLYASSADDKLYLRDSAGTDFEIGIAGGVGNTETILFPLYNGGSALAPSSDDGDRIWVRMPYSCDITGVEVSADVSGSVVVDLWKDTYANFPPTNADSITASAPPTLSSAQKSQDTTLTGWTTQVNAGDYITANIDSATTVTNAVVAVQCTRD